MPPQLNTRHNNNNFPKHILNSSLSLLTNPTRRRNLPMHTLTRHQFPTPRALSDFLKPLIPAFTQWGISPGTKNVHNLWLELSSGESLLTDSSPPVRTLSVLTLRVLGPQNTVLIEAGQDMSDGSFRVRNRPLSEKMKPGESPEEAAYRAVREELGRDGVVRIVAGSYRKVVEERGSVSYPGLMACYVLHCLDAVVEGLPEGEFCTDEDEGGGDDRAVSVKRHHWKWINY